MNNKVMKFELDPKSVKFKEILNQDFLELEIKAISTANPNRNGSHFTLESLQKAIPTFYNKPILGSFSVDLDDFRAHESDLEYDDELDNIYYDYTDTTSETPLGLIRSSDTVVVYHDEIDGLDWIKLTCAIWVKYNYKQVKKLLKSKNGYKKISVEVEVVDSEYTEDGVEVIKEFVFDGLTILGDKYETGIANAKAKILDLFEDTLFQKKQRALAFAYKALDEAKGIVEIPEVQDSNKNELTDNPIENEAPASEIEMDKELNQEGGEVVQMNLTMQAKIQLLEAYLRDFYNNWVWVCDLDEQYVYFSIEADEFRATYSITLDEVAEGEDQTGSVEVDIASRERVVRAWKVFEAEDEVQETVQEEFVEGTTEEVVEDVAEEIFEANEESVSETVENKAEGTVFEVSEDNTEEVFEEIVTDTVEEVVEEFKCDEACETEACDTEACEDEACETEACDTESCETEACEDECKFEDGCDDCEDDCEEFEAVQTTVEVDGEVLDVFALLERYNSLKEQVNELSYAIKENKKEKFIKVGEDFINADEFVDEENKANFISQINAKCEAEEFSTEEDVRNFAKGLLAMYYYENQNTHTNKTNDFSIEIENQAKKAPLTKEDKLKSAISKLNRI